MSVNPISQNSFDKNHAHYDKVRPGFRSDAVQWLVDHCDLVPGSRVLELACGTGKFTRTISDRGFDIVAVEPSSGMRESFALNFPAIPILEGSSYDLPVPDQSVDTVIVAQAFHWFSDEKALTEIARVLKPGKKLALIWNKRDSTHNDPDSINFKLEKALATYSAHVPQVGRDEWRKVFETTETFGDYEEHTISWMDRLPTSAIWPFCQSMSFVTAMAPEVQAELKAKVDALVSEAEKSGQVVDGMLDYERSVLVFVAKKV